MAFDGSFQRFIFELILYAVLGLGLETVFTAAMDWRKDPKRHLMGYSSLWYLPLYGLTSVFMHCAGKYIFPLHWLFRGLIYMVVIFAIEYLGMLALRILLGESPSQSGYYQSRWNVHGLIRLDYAPAMFLMGMLFEYVHFQLNVVV